MRTKINFSKLLDGIKKDNLALLSFAFEFRCVYQYRNALKINKTMQITTKKRSILFLFFLYLKNDCKATSGKTIQDTNQPNQQ